MCAPGPKSIATMRVLGSLADAGEEVAVAVGVEDAGCTAAENCVEDAVDVDEACGIEDAWSDTAGRHTGKK